jgi:hypothetical protein
MSARIARFAALGAVLCLVSGFAMQAGLFGCRPAPPYASPTDQPRLSTSASATPERLERMTLTCPPELVDTRRGGTDADRYVVPSEEARSALQRAITALVTAGGKRDSAARDATFAGYEIVDVASAEGVVLVREREDARRGGGAYLVRLGSSSPLMVQAPHTFFDQGTLELGWVLFRQVNARALFINTAHRYRAAAKRADGSYPADVAHASDSSFQAATLGALADPSIRVLVQLHGFGQRDGAPAAVVSTGASIAFDPLLARVARALGTALDARVDRFPDETSELGATTNVQAAAASNLGRAFIHIELSGDTRALLLEHKHRLEEVFRALLAAIGPG